MPHRKQSTYCACVPHPIIKHAWLAGSNLPGIASQFANQILGTANQLRNAEHKSANQKKSSAKRCNRCIALDSQQLARSQSPAVRQHDWPETAGAATAQPSAGPELASSSGLLLITRSFLIWPRIRFGTAQQGDIYLVGRIFTCALEDFLEMAVNLSTVSKWKNELDVLG